MKDIYEYRIEVFRDHETGHVVAEVPALGIGDWGEDVDEALKNIKDMIAFHVECLIDEGEVVPEETTVEEGVYVRVKVSSRAA